MNEKSDTQLLSEFVEQRSETAFAGMVERHLDLVYSAAVRMVCDSHMAQDVSQSVFVALAAQAQQLRDRPSLAGWLHTTTRNIAAKAVRAEIRRREREQEAAAMNELLSKDSEVSWDRIAPYLDEALGELNEPDREALLLRYFKNHDLRTVGATLGISDDAAQKRVSRAVERLREAFSRRGIAVGTSSLIVVISANAAPAAPIGLALTISSAAVLSGTAVTTTAVAASTTAKIIAMTTLQKSLVTASVIALTGLSLYEFRENSVLRKETRELRELQSPLRARLQELETRRGADSNQLAALNAQLAQLKSEQRNAELLKLRGQVGALRQQLTAEANQTAQSTGFSKMMSDPTMREYIRVAMVDLVKRRYAAFFQEAKLSPEQVDRFTQTMTDHFHAGAQRLAAMQESGNQPLNPNASDEKEIAEKLAAILGDAAAARFKEYNQEVPARTTVDLLNVELGAGRLTGEESVRLREIVKAEPFDLTHGISGDIDPAFFGSQSELDDYLMNVIESNQRVLQKAAEFLTADQLAALNTVLTNGLNARITQGAAFTPKRP